jgi:hypothetical protein
MTGIERIAAERKRQTEEEGFTAEHDGQWARGELSKAAICYLYPSDDSLSRWQKIFWPWDSAYWKPSPDNRIRDMEKAGALIAAEIDRLLRLEEKKHEAGTAWIASKRRRIKMVNFEEIESSQRQHHQEMKHYQEMCDLEEKRMVALISVLGPKLSKDGNMWCFLYGEDLQSGVAGFGETPYSAMVDFDRNFRQENIK